MSETAVLTSYDEVPYSGGTFPQTHPRRLSTVAAIFGLESADIHQARILELGSAEAANLAPMAAELPDATFVGVELSSVQTEKGCRLIESLGLKNITLRQMNILDITPEFGTFDYILVHGVYSWVPGEVREKILSICNENLSPKGVAYVSYNTYPGWRMRGMLRDMMLYHVGRITEVKQKVEQARALVKFLADSVPTEGNPYGMWVTQELEGMSNWRDSYLFHDSLGEVNEPVYFHEFMGRAADHGLQFLGESELATMVSSNFGTKVNETLSRIGKNIVAMEQYMDFVRNRMFRQTLLCHGDIKLKRNLTPEILERFSAGTRLRPVQDKPDLASREPLDFTSAGGGKLKVTQPIVKAAMLYLSGQSPQVVPFGELFDEACGLLNSQGVQLQDAPALQKLRLVLADALLKCFAGNLVELARHPYEYTVKVSSRPRTTSVIRKQAERGTLVPNLRHEAAQLDVVAQTLLQHLDGQHDQEALLDELIAKVDEGVLVLRENGEPLQDRERIRKVLAARIASALTDCARAALLLK